MLLWLQLAIAGWGWEGVGINRIIMEKKKDKRPNCLWIYLTGHWLAIAPPAAGAYCPCHCRWPMEICRVTLVIVLVKLEVAVVRGTWRWTQPFPGARARKPRPPLSPTHGPTLLRSRLLGANIVSNHLKIKVKERQQRGCPLLVPACLRAQSLRMRILDWGNKSASSRVLSVLGASGK